MPLLTHPYFYLLAIFLPALCAGVLMWPGWRKTVITWAPWTALPAVLLGLAGKTGGRITVPWMFFEARFGIDATAQVFLCFTAVVWLVAAVYAVGYIKEDDPHRARFFASFLLAMSGNFGLILAEDVFSFYFLFALMSFASFGLVAHTGTPAARRAGQVYIALVVLGEAFVFSALLLAVQATGTVHLTEMAAGVGASPELNRILTLAFIGFGVKAGALPLHVWLPLAHPVAPTPASAVLSGCMIKAGLLGWLRIFPLGVIALPAWGMVLIVFGLTAAFAAVLVGLTQEKPKTVLAYSSISQMGVMTTLLGMGLLSPAHWPALWAAVMIYAAHHALAKGALFLSVGTAGIPLRQAAGRGLHLAALVLPAVAVAGAPLTSGAVAKGMLKSAAGGPVKILISVAAVGTALIMLRFLVLIWPDRSKDARTAPVAPTVWGAWAVLLVAVAAFPVLIQQQSVVPLPKKGLPLGLSLSSLWPLLLGGVIGAAALWQHLRVPVRIPEGDLLSVYGKGIGAVRRGVLLAVERLASWQQGVLAGAVGIFKKSVEQAGIIETTFNRFTTWRVFGMTFLVLMLIFFALIR